MSQLCVWPATIVPEDSEQEFVQWMEDEFAVSAQPITTIKTLPSKLDDGAEAPETGGRLDFVFTIRDQDIAHFAVPRLALGVRWWDDYLATERDIVPDDTLSLIKEMMDEQEADTGGA